MTDSEALKEVVAGTNGLLSSIYAECLIIDMGTSRFDLTQKLAQQTQVKAGHYIDAPVSGGQIGVQQGTLSIMAGGLPCQLERAQPLFASMATKTTHVGAIGCGQLAKTANQMIVGATLNIVAETLFLAQKNGANSAEVKDALGGGFADSKILQIHGQRMAEKTINQEPVPKPNLRTYNRPNFWLIKANFNCPLIKPASPSGKLWLMLTLET